MCTSLVGHYSAYPSKTSIIVRFAIHKKEILILGPQGCSEAKELESSGLLRANHAPAWLSTRLHCHPWLCPETEQAVTPSTSRAGLQARFSKQAGAHEASRWP